jgi:phage tail protein X
VPGLNAQFPNTDDESQRRAALAHWIADPANVLTWRSIVNRVWHYHFGAGLVDTPSDFGRMGSPPSHPELLDWLAVWFRDEAHGSLKQLHRLLVLSATYRQTSTHRAEPAKLDADNRLLWRMNRTRLDAESVRDSTLAVAGKLDLTMGGPAVRQFGFKDDHSPVYDYAAFDPDAPGAYRRSIYRFLVRSVPDPFMERLDCPDPSLQTPKRTTTLTAIQALAMWNNRFMVRMAEHAAARAAGDADRLGHLVLGRRLSTEEAAYGARHGLANLARVLLNTSEFLFVD